MDAGAEPIEDHALAQQIGRQALRVYVESFLAAALLTAIVLALPRKRSA